MKQVIFFGVIFCMFFPIVAFPQKGRMRIVVTVNSDLTNDVDNIHLSGVLYRGDCKLFPLFRMFRRASGTGNNRRSPNGAALNAGNTYRLRVNSTNTANC